MKVKVVVPDMPRKSPRRLCGRNESVPLVLPPKRTVVAQWWLAALDRFAQSIFSRPFTTNE